MAQFLLCAGSLAKFAGRETVTFSTDGLAAFNAAPEMEHVTSWLAATGVWPHVQPSAELAPAMAVTWPPYT